MHEKISFLCDKHFEFKIIGVFDFKLFQQDMVIIVKKLIESGQDSKFLNYQEQQNVSLTIIRNIQRL